MIAAPIFSARASKPILSARVKSMLKTAGFIVLLTIVHQHGQYKGFQDGVDVTVENIRLEVDTLMERRSE